MTTEQQAAVEVENSILGKLKVTGSAVNNLFTILTFTGIVALCFLFYGHINDVRASNRAFVDALRDQEKSFAVALDRQTDAMKESQKLQREQNCLMSMPQNQRDRELCRRLSQ